MEKRFLFGVLLLLLVLLFSMGVAFGMRAIHRPAEEALSHASQLALQGDMDTALSLAQNAHSRWLRYKNITAAFADHTPMDDTERLFREMEIYAQTGETPHFSACCSELAAMVRAMYETHGFSLKNLF